MLRIAHTCLLGGLLCTLLLLLTINIAEPWLGGHYAFNGALRSTIGRNYARYGIIKTRFAPIQNQARTTPDRYDYRWNHPMMINVFVGMMFQVFGEHTWAARLPFLFFAFLSGLWIFLIAKEIWSRTTAYWALFLYTCSPLVGIFGSMANYESIVISTMLGSLYGYIRWKRTHAARYMLLSFALCTLGFWTDWPAWISSFFIFAYAAWEGIKQRGGSLIRRFQFPVLYAGMVLCNVAVFLLYYIYILKVNSEKVRALFKLRAGATASAEVMLKLIVGRTEQLITPLLSIVALSVLVLYPWLRLRLKKQIAIYNYPLLLSLLAPALIYMYVFKGQVFIHCFSAHYLIGFVVLGSAILLHRTFQRLYRWSRWLSWIGGTAFVLTYIWMAFPTTVEGHFSNGSPYEGRKREEWRSYELARWLRTQSTPTGRVVFVPGPPRNNMHFGYYLGRSFETRYSPYSLNSRSTQKRFELAVLHGKARHSQIAQRLMRTHSFTVYDSWLVFHFRRDSSVIRATRIHERPFTPLHRWLISMTQPPFERWEDVQTAHLYAQIYRGHKKPKASPQEPAEFRAAQVALYNRLIRQGYTEQHVELRALQKSLQMGMHKKLRISLDAHVHWLGFYTQRIASGELQVTHLFRIKKKLRRRWDLVVELSQRPKHYIHWRRYSIPRAPRRDWKKGELFTHTHTLARTTQVGTYRLILRKFKTRPKRTYPPLRVDFKPWMQLSPKIVGQSWRH